MSHIDFASVFIPRVSSWITEPMIQNTFWKNMLGYVSRVDFVSKMDKNCVVYNAAYVHMLQWMNTTEAIHFVERIAEKGQARIVYNDPEYWIVLKNNSLNQKPKTLGGRRIRLDIGEQSFDVEPKQVLYPIAPALPNYLSNVFDNDDYGDDSSYVTEEGAYDECSVSNTDVDFYEMFEKTDEGNYDFVDSSYVNELEKIISDYREKENAEYLQTVHKSRFEYGDEYYIVDDIIDEEYRNVAVSIDC